MLKREYLYPAPNRRAELTVPDFLEIQLDSFEWFQKYGLKEELKAISPIEAYDGKHALYFTGKVSFGRPK